ncbi:substrate-binding domain-containing protein [Rathayibacter toxicus]|uniref:substrate-binding domain-containing protein n=1 Tax=Rathayibacter toxicus TaxID=145458 RepID=UPI000CE91AC4|nr:substrate-binding domain-containing protein [Rathayibacter toxicus]PPI56833.1 sugar ABC transporter substrate-binding protein [Rathayibacter toxicus]QOD10398.1 substrate-binding domain-containing protein [Rathayibacter toxicus]QWL29069.1 sugar ABC transporter substrate-binding protein [Rathayibacter toxicus]
MTCSARHRSRLLPIAALSVLGILGLSACSSGSVGGATTRFSADYSSIIPQGDLVQASKDLVAKSLAATQGFSPDGTGPTAQKSGARIAFVGSDLTNGGVNAVASGVREAAPVIGWTIDIYDGKATAQGRTDAMNQAIASAPAAIIVGGFDPTEQASGISQAKDAGIPVLGWHSGASTGPGNGLFTNVSTDPLAVSQLAAAYAVADSNGTAGVAVFTDGQYDIAVKKSEAMKAYVSACSGCAMLSDEDSPIAEADQRMPGLIANLLQNKGSKLSYLLAINGNYFSGAQQALRAAGTDPTGTPRSIAAGDGDAAEFQRIRNQDYQAATVAEPLILQGWQLVDETNRALAGQGASGFVAAPELITKANVPSGDTFDPPSGYRNSYRTIWGK